MKIWSQHVQAILSTIWLIFSSVSVTAVRQEPRTKRRIRKSRAKHEKIMVILIPFIAIFL